MHQAQAQRHRTTWSAACTRHRHRGTELRGPLHALGTGTEAQNYVARCMHQAQAQRHTRAGIPLYLPLNRGQSPPLKRACPHNNRAES